MCKFSQVQCFFALVWGLINPHNMPLARVLLKVGSKEVLSKAPGIISLHYNSSHNTTQQGLTASVMGFIL